MSQNIDQLLSIDPIHQAEVLLNTKLHNNNNDVFAFAALNFAATKHEAVSKALEEIGDVNSWDQSLDVYMSILEAAGFKQVLVEDIPGTKDKFYVYWDDGVMISFDTYYNHTTINGGHVYLNFEADSEDNYMKAFSSSQCSHGPLKVIDGKYFTTVGKDCRQAVLHTLNKLKQHGTILPKWKKQPFLWLLHYMDTKVEGYDYKALNQERISQLPIEVQQAIGPYER